MILKFNNSTTTFATLLLSCSWSLRQECGKGLLGMIEHSGRTEQKC